MLTRIKHEIKSFTHFEKLFIFCAMLCGFCITSEYAITKPTSNSIFIAAYTVKFFPYAWLLLIPLNLFFVTFYNKLLSKWGCFRALAMMMLLVVIGNVFSAFTIQKIAFLPFIHNVWKDIYVMIMFQGVWSVIHSTVSAHRVKYLYGILFGVGGCGAVIGSLITELFAVKIGSPYLFLMTLPIYSILFVSYYYLLKYAHHTPGSQMQMEMPKMAHGFHLLKNSRYLQFILLIVILMQAGATMIEYQFNTFLEILKPERDLRTAYLGHLFSIVNMINIAFQFLGSFLLVQFLGLRRSHLFIPSILCGNALLFLTLPSFLLITFGYGTIKSFEHSLFTIIKEILYHPLGLAEKFKVKPIIDVFAFRTSKAIASCLIIFLQIYIQSKISFILSWSVFIIFAIWLYIVWRFFKHEDLLAIDNALK